MWDSRQEKLQVQEIVTQIRFLLYPNWVVFFILLLQKIFYNYFYSYFIEEGEILMLNVSLYDKYINVLKPVPIILCTRTSEGMPCIRHGYITWVNNKTANPYFLTVTRILPNRPFIRENFHYSDIHHLFYTQHPVYKKILVIIINSYKDVKIEDIEKYLEKVQFDKN